MARADNDDVQLCRGGANPLALGSHKQHRLRESGDEATDESAGPTQRGVGTAVIIDRLSHTLGQPRAGMAQPKGMQLFPMTGGGGRAVGELPTCSNCQALFKSFREEAEEDSLE